MEESKLKILETDVLDVNKKVKITGKTNWTAFEEILERLIESELWKFKDIKE